MGMVVQVKDPAILYEWEADERYQALLMGLWTFGGAGLSL